MLSSTHPASGLWSLVHICNASRVRKRHLACDRTPLSAELYAWGWRVLTSGHMHEVVCYGEVASPLGRRMARGGRNFRNPSWWLGGGDKG